MREIINVHIGQAGIQMAESLWQVYNQQFCLDRHGQYKQPSSRKQIFQQCQINKEILYYQTPNSHYVPRAIFYDSDPITVDQLSNKFKNIPSSHLIKAHKNDATFSSALYDTQIRNKGDIVIDQIRKQVQRTQSFEGFMFHHSISGGTGSGFTSYISQRLSMEYGKKSKFNFAIYPSQQYSDSIVAPFNSVLSTHCLLQHFDITIPIQNQSLYNIHSYQLESDVPYFHDINRTISQLCSNITLPMCARNCIQNLNFSEIETNMIPYPRIHFLGSSFAPFISHDKQFNEKKTLKQITQAVFNKDNYLLSLNPDLGKYISNMIFYRGNVSNYQAISCSQMMKNRYRKVDWVQTGIKLNIFNKSRNAPMPHYNDQQVSLITNNTAIDRIFSRMNHKFDLMYAKRAFVHWFVGWMQEGQFSQARQDLAALQKDFQQGSIQWNEGQQQ